MDDDRSGESRAVAFGRGGWRSAVTIASAVFAVLTLISSVQIYTLRAAEHESVTVLGSLAFGAATWIIWAIATPVILRLGQRFGFARGQRLRSLVIHLIVALLVHLPATFLIFWAGTKLFGGETLPLVNVLLPQAIGGTRLPFALLLYASLLGLARALDLVEHLRAQEARAARLEMQATQARLDALATRLQPHFLFNSLHTIGALIDEDPARARALVAQFGELLRDALDGSDARDIPLAEELRLLERYLEIEQIRFADRLQLSVACAPDAAGVLVPRFLLQPLAENALHHGIAPHARGGAIAIDARRSGDQRDDPDYQRRDASRGRARRTTGAADDARATPRPLRSGGYALAGDRALASCSAGGGGGNARRARTAASWPAPPPRRHP